MSALLEAANQALAACGRGKAVKAYWLGKGWYVTDDPHAIVPRLLGDSHWRVFVSAPAGYCPADLGRAMATQQENEHDRR